MAPDKILKFFFCLMLKKRSTHVHVEKVLKRQCCKCYVKYCFVKKMESEFRAYTYIVFAYQRPKVWTPATHYSVPQLSQVSLVGILVIRSAIQK